MAKTLEELSILLDAADVAIAALMAGERVVRITRGDTMSEYGQTKLKDLQDYKTGLITRINALNSRPRYYRVSTSKGV